MRWKSESGQALILVAFSIVVLIVFIGPSVDTEILRYEKRVLQDVADSATTGNLNSHFSLHDVTITTKLVCLSSANLGLPPVSPMALKGFGKAGAKRQLRYSRRMASLSNYGMRHHKCPRLRRP